jgi:hypothetical protein
MGFEEGFVGRSVHETLSSLGSENLTINHNVVPSVVINYTHVNGSLLR